MKPPFHNWFQNLNESGKRLFYFRGSLGSSWETVWLKYEICSGPALRLELSDSEGHRQLSIAPGLFGLWLTLPRWRTPDHLHNRHWGFYVFEWTFRAFFGADSMGSSSSDPWYYSIHFNLLDFLFGRTVHFEDSRIKSYGPRTFEFRGKRFVMDDIELRLGHWFRPRIPMALYCKKIMRMHLECKKPPLRAGKGENSWDLEDDGSYGMCAPYDGPRPSWQNKEEVFEACCRYYCESAAEEIKRYGRAADDKEPVGLIGFRYIGRAEAP